MRDLAVSGILIGAPLAGIALNARLGKRLKDRLADTPALDRRQLGDVYEHAGLGRDFPTFAAPGFGNAAYLSPGASADWSLKSLPTYNRQLAQEPGLHQRVRDQGAVVYDPHFMRAGILAHEAGHARLEAGAPWYSPSRINQRWLRPAGDLLGALAPLGGVLAGAATKSPVAGALGGLALGGLTGLPTLINEYQASRNAGNYLDQSAHRKETVVKNKQALRDAYWTYLAGSLAAPTLAGGLAGGYFAAKQAAEAPRLMPPAPDAMPEPRWRGPGALTASLGPPAAAAAAPEPRWRGPGARAAALAPPPLMPRAPDVASMPAGSGMGGTPSGPFMTQPPHFTLPVPSSVPGGAPLAPLVSHGSTPVGGGGGIWNWAKANPWLAGGALAAGGMGLYALHRSLFGRKKRDKEAAEGGVPGYLAQMGLGGALAGGLTSLTSQPRDTVMRDLGRGAIGGAGLAGGALAGGMLGNSTGSSLMSLAGMVGGGVGGGLAARQVNQTVLPVRKQEEGKGVKKAWLAPYVKKAVGFPGWANPARWPGPARIVGGAALGTGTVLGMSYPAGMAMIRAGKAEANQDSTKQIVHTLDAVRGNDEGRPDIRAMNTGDKVNYMRSTVDGELRATLQRNLPGLRKQVTEAVPAAIKDVAHNPEVRKDLGEALQGAVTDRASALNRQGGDYLKHMPWEHIAGAGGGLAGLYALSGLAQSRRARQAGGTGGSGFLGGAFRGALTAGGAVGGAMLGQHLAGSGASLGHQLGGGALGATLGHLAGGAAMG